jgi:hypothetical protein
MDSTGSFRNPSAEGWAREACFLPLLITKASPGVASMTDPSAPHAVSPLLVNKLYRPHAPATLMSRPRLLDQLTAWQDRRLILVSASAGYGKTALISQWLESADVVHAWLSLDEHDNDLATFLLYLAAAIRTVSHDAIAAIDPLLRAPTLFAPSRLADALLQDLAALPGPLILALDDYHTINAPEIHTSIISSASCCAPGSASATPMQKSRPCTPAPAPGLRRRVSWTKR